MIEDGAIQDGDPLADIFDDLVLQFADFECDPEGEEYQQGWEPDGGDDEDFVELDGDDLGEASGRKVAPVEELDGDRLLEEIQIAHRSIAAAQARQAQLITELAHRRCPGSINELTGRRARDPQSLSIGMRAVTEEIALELSLSERMAESLTDTSVGLCLTAPDTLTALGDGDIDWLKADTILNLVQTLIQAQTDTNIDLPPDEQTTPEELGRDLEARLLNDAPGQRVADLKKSGARAMIETNPRAAEKRHARKRARRAFWYSPDEDSMCRLGGYLPADAGMRAKNALTRLAYHARNTATSEDNRTLDQLRIDSLVDTLTHAAETLHHETAKNTPDSSTTENNPTPEAGHIREAGHIPDADTSTTRDDTTSDRDDITTNRDDTDPDGEHTAAATATAAESTTHTPRRRARPPRTEATADTNVNDTNVNDSATSTHCGCGPGRGRSAETDPRILITISAGTLTGDDDLPGYLHGYGPIVASMARDIAATGTWRCAITDTTHGTLLGLGTSTYTPAYEPTQALRRHLITRDRTCRVPGCNTPATLCDVDHRIPWPDGVTCECCTECLCGNHHRLKHETGFTLTPSTNPEDPPGTLYWTTPAGHQYPSYEAQLAPNKPGPGPTPPPTPTEATPTPTETTETTDASRPGSSECRACIDAETEITDDHAISTGNDTPTRRRYTVIDLHDGDFWDAYEREHNLNNRATTTSTDTTPADSNDPATDANNTAPTTDTTDYTAPTTDTTDYTNDDTIDNDNTADNDNNDDGADDNATGNSNSNNDRHRGPTARPRITPLPMPRDGDPPPF